MGTVLTICGKDLRQRLRDRSALIYGVLAPLALAGVFSLVLGDVTDGPSDVRWLVVDEAGGEAAEPLVDQVLPTVAAELGGRVTEVADRDAAEARVAADEADAALIVPAALADLVGAPPTDGAPADVRFELVAGADSGLSGAVLEAVAAGYADQIGRIADLATAAALLDAPETIDELIAVATQPALELSASSVTGRVLDASTGLAAGMAVFFLLFTVQFGVVSLLEERQAGTLQRLYASPVARSSVLAAKALTSFVLGVVSMVVLAVASALLLGADWGPPGAVLVLIVGAVLAATGLMALIGAVARTAEQANNASAAAAVVLGMLGGSFFPVSGALLERVQLLTPHAWFLRGLSDVAGGVGTPLAATAGLAAIAAVTGGAAALLLRRREVRT